MIRRYLLPSLIAGSVALICGAAWMAAYAQLPGPGFLVIGMPLQQGTNGQCLYVNGSALGNKTCSSAPTGSAGGDLSGTYPNPSVASLGGKAVSLAAALTTTGAGAPTLAFPGSAATFTFPSASETLMANDLSNATANTLQNINITGALKGSGAGVISHAACADLSNAATSCSTDTTSASNISSGTLASARGGAGTITGALKGNGAGVVSQAACADLSNATALCSQSPGTGVATALGVGTNSNGGVITQSAAGTWTPAITASSTAGTPAYQTNGQVGSYVQIGNEVTAWFWVNLSGWTGSPSGNVTITGLPVAAASAANDYGGCSVHDYILTGTVTSLSYISARIAPSSTAVTLLYYTSGGSSANFLTTTQVGTSSGVIIGGVCNYHT